MRVRSALGRAHARMSPGFALVLERMFGLIDAKALHCAVELGIPDLLHGGAMRAGEIADATGADPDAVERMLRYLVSRDLFSAKRGGRYANNFATDVLRRDHPYSWRGWVEFFGSDWNAEIWNELPARVATGVPATEAAFGVGFFEYLNRANPDAGRAFNDAMAAGSAMHGVLFAETIDPARFGSICDIGGGSGAFLANVLRRHARLRGIVFDLPELAEPACRLLDSAGVADRADFVGGDFFASVPVGHDLYTLLSIVHDWDDDSCVEILTNVRRALADGGRIMVVESSLSDGPGDAFTKASDMVMLVHADGGRERTPDEYAELFAQAGLRIETRTVLPSLFDIFELVPIGGVKGR